MSHAATICRFNTLAMAFPCVSSVGDPADETGHSCARTSEQSSYLPGVSQLASEGLQEDQLATMMHRIDSSIGDAKAHHALVRWGDLHQRMTSGDVLLGTMASHHGAQHPRIDAPSSESSPRSHHSEGICQANIMPLGSSNGAPEACSGVQSRLSDRDISTTVMRALQGSLTACAILLSGQLHTDRIRPLAMYNLLKPVAITGILRARLVTFVHHYTKFSCQKADATQMAFAAAVSTVLHMHAVQMQTCSMSVQLRRVAETSNEDMGVASDSFPTPNELVQHTTSIRSQVAMLASLCWCHVDEARDVAEGEHVPMKWETAPFFGSSALLDHLHAFLATCNPVHAHVCRYLLGESMRPLLDQVFCWTHSAEDHTNTCLSIFRDRPCRRFFNTTSPSSIEEKPWRLPLTGLRLELPGFMAPLHDIILTTGVQIRFLASLSQCQFMLPLVTDSALRQMQGMRAGVSICSNEPSACMRPVHTARKLSVPAGQDPAWGPSMAWHAPAVQHALSVTCTGVKERQDAVNTMMARLSESRAAEEAGVALERLQDLQNYQRLAQLEEKRAVQLQHVKRLQRAAELQKQQCAAEEHQSRAQVAAELAQELLDEWRQDVSVGHTQSLVKEVWQLLHAGQKLDVLEMRMAWRLQRWKLQPQRTQALQRLLKMEQALLAHFQRQTNQATAGVAGASAAAAPNSTRGSHVSGAARSIPQTFFLSHFSSRARSVTSGSSAIFSMGQSGGAASSIAWQRSQPGVPHSCLQPVAEENSLLMGSDGQASNIQPMSGAGKCFALSPVAASLPLCMPGMSKSMLPWPSDLKQADVTAPCGAEASGSNILFMGQSAASWPQQSQLSCEEFIRPAAEIVRSDAASRASFGPFGGMGTSASDWGAPLMVADAISELPGLSNASSTLVASTEAARRATHKHMPGRWSAMDWGGCAAAISSSQLQASFQSGRSHSHTGGAASTAVSSRQGLRKRWLPQVADLDGLLESAEVASTVSAVGCVPAEAALECIVKEPLLGQYRLSSSACMRLVCDDLHLPGVCEALHDVLLCGNGHFLQVIIDAIRRQLSHFGELRVKRLDDAISEALTDSLMKYHGLSISHLGLKFSVILDPLRVVSADTAAARLLTSDELEDGIFEQWVSAQSTHADEAPDPPKPVLNLPIDPNDVSALDAMQITCTVEAPLQLLVPPAAITAMADVFTVLLRVRWAAMHLEHTLWTLRKICRHHPRRHEMTPAVRESLNRLGVTCHALQVGSGTLRSIQTYMYKGLQQQWRSFHSELMRSELDLAQCARLVHRFAVECSCQCLIASDAQLASVVANLLVLCQDGANRASELLLGYPTVGPSHAARAPSFQQLCENVLKVETWSQMQRSCADLKTRVSFLTDCVAFKSNSIEQLRSLHTDLSFNK